MIEDQKLQSLADTLARTGLACSPGEALRMAQSISGTEKKVAKHFDAQNEKIDEDLTRKKSYKEEIDDLIQKTSPEFKNYHVPIRGYQREEVSRVFEEPPTVSQDIKEVEEIVEKQDEPVEVEVKEEPKLEVYETEEAEEEQYPQVEEQEIPEPVAPQPVIPEPVLESKPVLPELAKPVMPELRNIPKDLLEDDRSLSEIMNEDAASVYTNQGNVDAVPEAESVQETEIAPEESEPEFSEEETPEYTVFDYGESVETPVEELEEQEEALPREEEEFILDVESAAQQETQNEPDLVTNQAPVQQLKQEPEQLFKEIKEEKSPDREFKNPIENVDLMNYFKFG